MHLPRNLLCTDTRLTHEYQPVSSLVPVVHILVGGSFDLWQVDARPHLTETMAVSASETMLAEATQAASRSAGKRRT